MPRKLLQQLHKEFLRAGSDVMQTFTFFSTDDTLQVKHPGEEGYSYKCSDLNNAACKLAHEVAREGDALVAGGVTQTTSYTAGKGKAFVQANIKDQVKTFMVNKVDFIICEFFMYVEEMEWAIEEVTKSGLPVVASMCIGLKGDYAGVSAGECAVRMARAGADVVGVNCLFDPYMTVDTIKVMKSALDEAGLKPFLLTQPNGFFTTGTGKEGYLSCPEYPFAMEARTVSRFDVHKYARAAYDLGVRYVGGCCGFEAYHIRAIAEELAEERGKWPAGSAKNKPWGQNNVLSSSPFIRKRVGRQYWESIVPSSGRSKPPSHPIDPKPQ
ncbi:betaine--homocysteine S-methyltransferase 1-like isoform X2 [Palaemon carinicauda]|uniref:betaine--homocysteine S-methyltransferase 1-like isoform X2 n=1 Tax=Palaemon carinicauda TaxID=392227 RepID=UPI0035B6A7B6